MKLDSYTDDIDSSGEDMTYDCTFPAMIRGKSGRMAAVIYTDPTFPFGFVQVVLTLADIYSSEPQLTLVSL